MKQRRCAEQYHLISPQSSVQASQPDSAQSLRINTPGFLEPLEFMGSCYVPFLLPFNLDSTEEKELILECHFDET